jgi:hypothetical protein
MLSGVFPALQRQPTVRHMIDETADNTGKAEETEIKGLMIKYGITNTPIDCFRIGNFKYTHLKDAIAEAERMQASKA